jgi:four helix bundle protein
VAVVGQASRPYPRDDRRRSAKDGRRFYDGLRAAAGSIPNNIAEGHARFFPLDNRDFLTIACASLAEVQNRLLEGKHRKFCEKDFDEAWALSKRAAGAIGGLMRHLSTKRAKRNADEIRRKINGADEADDN